MDIKTLQKHFGKIGARVKVSEAREIRRRGSNAGIDIGSDRKGEYFDFRAGPQDGYCVLDMWREQRHLLLMSEPEKAKFLCGFDERHWFVCAVPSATNVRTALESLQPPEVRWAVHNQVKRVKNRFRRRNEAFVRQGEWFFLPASWLGVDPAFALKNEPLSRGAGSKPHMCQYLYRISGEVVMVCDQYPRGVSPEKYERILQSDSKARSWNWQQMRRGAAAFARGRVWHPDHKTVVLDDWHRVLMNTEHQAPGSQAVFFLD
jgi:hypothetical protein